MLADRWRVPDRYRGWGLAALGMVLVSTDSIFVRFSEASAANLAFLVAVFALPTQLLMGRVAGGSWRPVASVTQPALLIGCLAAVSQISFIAALTRTNVSNVVVIVAAAPVMAAITGRMLLGERTTRRLWLAIGIVFVGIVLTVSSNLGRPRLVGDLLALVATTSFATNMSLWRRHPELNRFNALALSAAVMLSVTVWFADPLGQSTRVYLAAAAMGAVFNTLGRLANSHAPRFAPAAEVALFTPTETVCATLWAWLFFAEQPRAETLLGGVVILTGVIVGTLAGTRAAPSPERLTMT